jgi:hypothetical protein
LRHQVGALFAGVDPARGELTVEIRCGDEPSTLIAAAGRVPFIPGSVPEPDVALTGPLNGVVGLVAGRIDPTFALEFGVSVIGDARRLHRLGPRPTADFDRPLATGSPS